MIAIVDVCSGNLRSVERALAQVGGDVVVTRDPDVVRRADKIVVPGQGAFGVFMRGLRERGLGDSLREAIASGRPYLGICLGMQILFDDSEEQGPREGEPRPKVVSGLRTRHETDPLASGPREGDPRPKVVSGLRTRHETDPLASGPCAGLGVVRGHVIKLAPGDPKLKVPHIGWNRCTQRKPEPLLAGIADGAYFYFTHSYHAVPADPALLALDAEHGIRITAAIRTDNVFACQFHPEKSQATGLRLLESFVTS